jgi:hypothetical protein
VLSKYLTLRYSQSLTPRRGVDRICTDTNHRPTRRPCRICVPLVHGDFKTHAHSSQAQMTTRRRPDRNRNQEPGRVSQAQGQGAVPCMHSHSAAPLAKRWRVPEIRTTKRPLFAQNSMLRLSSPLRLFAASRLGAIISPRVHSTHSSAYPLPLCEETARRATPLLAAPHSLLTPPQVRFDRERTSLGFARLP